MDISQKNGHGNFDPTYMDEIKILQFYSPDMKKRGIPLKSDLTSSKTQFENAQVTSQGIKIGDYAVVNAMFRTQFFIVGNIIKNSLSNGIRIQQAIGMVRKIQIMNIASSAIKIGGDARHFYEAENPVNIHVAENRIHNTSWHKSNLSPLNQRLSAITAIIEVDPASRRDQNNHGGNSSMAKILIRSNTVTAVPHSLSLFGVAGVKISGNSFSYLPEILKHRQTGRSYGWDIKGAVFVRDLTDCSSDFPLAGCSQ